MLVFVSFVHVTLDAIDKVFHEWHRLCVYMYTYLLCCAVRFISFHLIPNYLTNMFKLEEKLLQRKKSQQRVAEKENKKLTNGVNENVAMRM